MDVELSWNGGTNWTGQQTDNGDTTDTAHSVILGSPANNWGHVWTAAELSAANFRVRLTSNSSSGNRDFSLDWVPVRVTYSLATTTTLVSDINPSNVGQSVTFTATVAPAAATGTVTFRDGATQIGTPVALVGGVASISTAALTGGSHNITAIYSGDATYGSSTGAVTQNVNQAPAFTSANTATFAVGVAGTTFDVNATGFPAPTFALSAALPAPLALNTTTGVISGTAAAGTVGVYTFTITASNGVTPDAIQTFTLNIVKGPQTITFAQPPTPAGFGTTYTINPTASSGLPVTVATSWSPVLMWGMSLPTTHRDLVR